MPRSALAAAALATLAIVVATPEAGRAQACAFDTTPPDITVTSPSRASALTQGGVADDVVAIVGMASDSQNAVASLMIDGVELLASPFGAVLFNENTTSRWGLNVVEITAVDECGNARDVVHPYLRGGSFGPVVTSATPAAELPDAVVASLGPVSLNDGDRNDPDDVATLIEELIGSVDLESAVPVVLNQQNLPACNCSVRCPLSSTCCVGSQWIPNVLDDFRITRGAIGNPSVAVTGLTAGSNVIRPSISLPALSVPITAIAYSCTLGNFGSTTFNATFSTTGGSGSVDLGISATPGNATVSAISSNVDITGLDVSGSGLLGVLLNILDTLGTNLFEPLIEDGFEDAVENGVPSVLEELAEGFGLATSLALPPPFDVETNVASRISSLEIRGSQPSGRFEIGAAAQAYPSAAGPGTPAGAPGPIERGGSIPAFGPADFGLAVRDDFVNQALWSAWYAGGLDLPDLSAEANNLGLPVIDLSAFAHLPPVVMPGPTVQEIEIGVGDLELDGLIDLSAALGGPPGTVLPATIRISGQVVGVATVDAVAQKLGFDATGSSVQVEFLAPALPSLTNPLVPMVELFLESWLPAQMETLLGAIRLPALPLATLGHSGLELALGAPATADRPDDDQTRVGGVLANRASCGDGLIRLAEACDDGNGSLGDGCDDTCQIEPGFTCGGQPSVCSTTADLDGDGRPDVTDNCTVVGNPSQLDTDGDGFGNPCDCDFDNDGFCSIADFNIFLEDFMTQTPSSRGTDMNEDGFVTISDFGPFVTGFQNSQPGPAGAIP